MSDNDTSTSERQARAVKTRAAIAEATGGSGTYTRHRLSGLLLTGGVVQVADAAKCWWLVDDIAIYQRTRKIANDPRLQEHQFWRLVLNEDGSAKLHCDRDEGDTAFTADIPYTDFPLPEGIKIWVANGVMYLPCEH